MFKSITICLGLVAAITLPTILQADEIVQPPSPRASYMLLANETGTSYGIPPSEIKTVLKLESNYDQDAVGDRGHAHGVAQYHRPTFDRYESLYFRATGTHLDYGSGTDQIMLMAWQWKNYPKSKGEWSTWRHAYGRKSA